MEPTENGSADDLVRRLREKARVLYEGAVVPHHSCGIALAATFGLPTRPYQALRKGGITGEGLCGAVMAGQLVLGELLGDPDPTGPVTPALREAMAAYLAAVRARLDRRRSATLVCNDLTGQFADFGSAERLGFCTGVVETVAAALAEVLLAQGVRIDPTPVSSLK
ncbi:MAG: C-GCAxxG-C-C family (seleno)protein [Deltaproteobacteria bacterium]